MWSEMRLSQLVSASFLRRERRLEIESDHMRNGSMSHAYGMKIMNSDGSVSFLISDAHLWTKRLTNHEDKETYILGPGKSPTCFGCLLLSCILHDKT